MKMSDLKPGDVIFADGDFDCLLRNQACEVKQDDGGLYVTCHGEEREDGGRWSSHHYLEGQLDDDEETIVGFARSPWTTPPA